MNNEKQSRPILIDTSIGYKPVIQSDPNKAGFFQDAHLQAHRVVKEILEQDTRERQNNNNSQEAAFHPNNIIAFLGGRGTGKTSTMLSVAKDITEGRIYIGERNSEGHCQIWNTTSCITSVKTIDPSHFHDSMGILEVIVSCMFEMFLNKLKKGTESPTYDKQKELLIHFETVKKSIDAMRIGRKDDSNSDILEQLQSLASTHSLSNSLKALIDNFLQFSGSTEGKNSNVNPTTLLIPIDDFDMNFQHAYNMIEDIRKYLILPNVLIFIAADPELLQDTIEHGIRRNLEAKVQHRPANHVDVQELAFQYQFKLIPPAHRVMLPSFAITSGKNAQPLTIVHKHKPEGSEVDESLEKAGPLDSKLLRLIFQKTGLIFLPREFELHPIIPTTIRELHGLVNLLLEMPDVTYSKAFPDSDEGNQPDNAATDEKRKMLDNCQRFRHYFLQTWVPYHLNIEQQKVLDEFLKAETTQKNMFIVQYIHTKIESFMSGPDFSERGDAYKLVTNRANKGFNISLGDVNFMLTLLLDLAKDKTDRNFANAMKILYTIILTEDLFSMESTNETFLDDQEADYFGRHYSSFQRLIAGSIFCGEYDRLMRRSEAGSTRRDLFDLPFVDLKTVLQLSPQDRKHNEPSLFLRKLGLYFLCSCSRVGKDNSSGKGLSYRTEFGLPYYDKVFHTAVRYVEFDVLGFLLNLLNVDNVIHRSFQTTTATLYKGEVAGEKPQYQFPIIPYYSIDVLDRIIENLDDNPRKASTYANYVAFLLGKRNILGVLEFLDETMFGPKKPFFYNIYYKTPYVRMFLDWNEVGDEEKSQIKKLLTNHANDQLLSSLLSGTSLKHEFAFPFSVEKDNRLVNTGDTQGLEDRQNEWKPNQFLRDYLFWVVGISLEFIEKIPESSTLDKRVLENRLKVGVIDLICETLPYPLELGGLSSEGKKKLFLTFEGFYNEFIRKVSGQVKRLSESKIKRTPKRLLLNFADSLRDLLGKYKDQLSMEMHNKIVKLIGEFESSTLNHRIDSIEWSEAEPWFDSLREGIQHLKEIYG